MTMFKLKIVFDGYNEAQDHRCALVDVPEILVTLETRRRFAMLRSLDWPLLARAGPACQVPAL